MANFIPSRHVTCPILTRDLSADLLAFTDWSPPRQHRYVHTQKHCQYVYHNPACSFLGNWDLVLFNLGYIFSVSAVVPVYSDQGFIKYAAIQTEIGQRSKGVPSPQLYSDCMSLNSCQHTVMRQHVTLKLILCLFDVIAHPFSS